MSYDWDMGDGTIVSDAGPSLTHTYATAGTYTISVTATNSVSTDTATTSVLVQDPPAGGQVLINSGGPTYQDGSGRDWLADTAFTGGNTYTRSTAISGTNDDPIYQSERWAASHTRFRSPAPVVTR